MQYCDYETFSSNTDRNYQFLIWKLQLENPEEFSNEITDLIENKGYQFIPGAWDVVTCGRDGKPGYKVVALYKQ